jgi:EmrB/QacA subfamily drug resistance transporter
MAARTIRTDEIDLRAGTAARAHAQHRTYPGLALAVIVTTQLMLVLDGTIVNIALPNIQRSLDISDAGLSWVVNAYLLAFGGLLLLGGRAGDILGRRRLLVAGIGLFTLASLAGGLATSAGWLLAARAAQGAGAALAAPSGLALIATTFADGPERNRALGIYSAVQAAGASLGLIAGGMLTDWVSWRWVLFVNVPIGIAIVLLTPRVVQESERHAGRFDLAGALSATTGMFALVYAFIRAASNGWSNAGTLAAFAAAVVLLALFLVVEVRAEQPIMPLRLLANRGRAGAYLDMLLLPAAMFGMFFLLAQFVQEVLGYSPLKAGFAFLPLTAVIFAASQAVPRWLPRVGPKPFMVSGTALILAGMLWLTQISADSDYLPDLLGPMLLFGIGVGFSLVPLTVLILSGVEERDSGAASGLLQTTQQAGGALGIAILVSVFGNAGRNAAEGGAAGGAHVAQTRQAIADAMGNSFAAAAIIAAAALLVALFAVRTNVPNPSDGR